MEEEYHDIWIQLQVNVGAPPGFIGQLRFFLQRLPWFKSRFVLDFITEFQWWWQLGLLLFANKVELQSKVYHSQRGIWRWVWNLEYRKLLVKTVGKSTVINMFTILSVSQADHHSNKLRIGWSEGQNSIQQHEIKTLNISMGFKM